MQTILNLSGVRVHVGFHVRGRSCLTGGNLYGVDEADCYVCCEDDTNTLAAMIDDIDALGIMRNGVFHSVRTLAEEWIDGQSAAIELADRRSVVENRVDLRDWSEPEI